MLTVPTNDVRGITPFIPKGLDWVRTKKLQASHFKGLLEVVTDGVVAQQLIADAEAAEQASQMEAEEQPGKRRQSAALRVEVSWR